MSSIVRTMWTISPTIPSIDNIFFTYAPIIRNSVIKGLYCNIKSSEDAIMILRSLISSSDQLKIYGLFKPYKCLNMYINIEKNWYLCCIKNDNLHYFLYLIAKFYNIDVPLKDVNISEHK